MRAGWLALPRIVGGLLAFGVALSAAAAPKSLLVVCSDEPRGRELLVHLDGWMSTARVQPATGTTCRPPPGAYRGTFHRVGAATIFRLLSPDGGTLEQAIPWVGSTDTPLEELEAAGRLPQLSLLLEALLAEERLGLADPPEPPPPPPTVAPPRRRSPPPPAAGASDTPPTPREAPTSDPAEEAAPTESPPPPDPDPAPEKPAGPPAADGEGGPDGGDSVEARGEAPDAAPTDGPPEPSDEPAVGAGTTASDEPSDSDPPGPREDVDRRKAPPEGPVEDFGVPLRRPWRKDVSVDLAARFRSPDFFAGEVALTASWGPLFAQGGFQLPAPWRIGGRPLQVAALTVGAGVQHPVELPSGELRLRAGVVAEAVEVRRLDLPWAEDHHHLDLGVGLGAEWRVRVFGSWVGLYLEGGGMPTARTIRLPEGAFAPLGRSWARLGLRVGWGR